MMPGKAGTPLPVSPLVLKFVSLIQPTVLLALAVFAGVSLSPKVDLSAPAFEALARGDSFMAALKPQIIPGAITGLIAAAAIVLTETSTRSSLLVGAILISSKFSKCSFAVSRGMSVA